ncbi:hypothetical protein SKAU_G00022930 [Synaphobranchus kaupii]|uniref:Uncharacterized protein n=1 Tax=Synaphobranchus kaupii TaxID=118154 RepID=A0A9Q1GC89_SYNKA|nr:hypothetical protein SKAU_G00022930 [Synaphobranchus kaupii]
MSELEQQRALQEATGKLPEGGVGGAPQSRTAGGGDCPERDAELKGQSSAAGSTAGGSGEGETGNCRHQT